MKLKIIKSEKQIKSGAYFRADITMTGSIHIEHRMFAGKPFTDTIFGRPIRVIRERWPGFTRTSSILDAIGHKEPFVNAVALIPFSNKAWNYLKSITSLREFAKVLNPGTFNDGDFREFLLECEYRLDCDMDYSYGLTR